MSKKIVIKIFNLDNNRLIVPNKLYYLIDNGNGYGIDCGILC